MTRVLRVLATQIECRMLLVVIVVMITLSLSSPYFLTASNLYNVMDQSVVTGMVALGQTLVILIGGIDLSVGALAGVTGVVLGLGCHAVGLTGGIAACLGAGMLAGLINGVIITYGGVAAFVVTLGMMAIGRSMAYVLSGASSISDLPAGLADISTGMIAGLPTDFICLLAAYALCWVFLTYAKGGRTLYAIGSNVGGGTGCGPVDRALERVRLRDVRRDERSGGDLSGIAGAFDRSDRRFRSGTGCHCRGGHRRGEPVRRPRLDHRHAAWRLHHGVHPQRAQSAERLAVLAGHCDRRDHHCCRPGGTIA